MSATTYSPQEAAAVSGAPLAAIQKAITTRKIPARVTGMAKRRQLDETALLAFALVAALPAALRLSLGAAYQLLRRMPSGSDAGELVIGEIVRIDAGKALAAARRRLALYDRARQIIVSNPAIMGGMPTIRGTRITAQSILGRLESGRQRRERARGLSLSRSRCGGSGRPLCQGKPAAGTPGRQLVARHFLIDENLSPLLARHLRTAHGFDAVHVQELGLRGASDADILARAIVEDRIIVTSNADDFRRLGARTPAPSGGNFYATHDSRIGRFLPTPWRVR